MKKQKKETSETVVDKISFRLKQFSGFGTTWNFVSGTVLLFAVGFRLYKAHNTGIIFDEVWTYEEFCTNLHTALTQYHTNNHILNSVFIILAQKVFGSYEHFLRIPAVIFGILFCGGVWLLVFKTVHHPLVRIAAILLILMNWFVVDLTYLGRGYAIALGAIFAGIVILVTVCDKNGKNRAYHWGIAFFFIAMNFLTLGSMLSGLPIVLSMNFIYGLWLITDSLRQGKKVVIKAMIRLTAISAGTFCSLGLLYLPLFSTIRQQSKTFEAQETFLVYMKHVLWEPLIFLNFSRIRFNTLVYKIFIVLLFICSIIYIVRWILRLGKERSLYLFLSEPAVQIILLFLGTLFFMWIQRVVFDVSLGMPRNGVFTFVLMLLTVAVIMDRAIETFHPAAIVSHGLCGVCVLLMGILCFLNWPSYNAVQVHPNGWAIESSIGPLARMLRQIDSQKTWKIKLTGYTEDAWRPIRYYKNKKRGYHIELTEGDTYDVWIVPKTIPNSRLVCLNYKRFTEHQCCVVANTASFRDEPVFYQVQQAPPQKP